MNYGRFDFSIYEYALIVKRILLMNLRNSDIIGLAMKIAWWISTGLVLWTQERSQNIERLFFMPWRWIHRESNPTIKMISLTSEPSMDPRILRRADPITLT